LHVQTTCTTASSPQPGLIAKTGPTLHFCRLPRDGKRLGRVKSVTCFGTADVRKVLRSRSNRSHPAVRFSRHYFPALRDCVNSANPLRPSPYFAQPRPTTAPDTDMKRSSDRQITKDDVPSGEDSDDGLREGFDKAAPEVMAKRRIVKASAFTSAPSAPNATANGAASDPSSAPSGPATDTGSPAARAIASLAPAAEARAVNDTDGESSGAKSLGAAKGSNPEDKEPSREHAPVNASKTSTPAPVAAIPLVSDVDLPSATSPAPHYAPSAVITPAAVTTPAVVATPAAVPAAAAATVSAAAPTSGHAGTVEPAEAPTSAGVAVPFDNPAGVLGATVGIAVSRAAAAPDIPAASEPVVHTADPNTSPAAPTSADDTEDRFREEAKKPVFSFGGIGSGAGATCTSFVDAAAAATGFSFAGAPGVQAAPATTSPVATTDGTAGSEPASAAKFAETDVVTGEEEEKETFRSRCKLFLLDGAKWVERGVGSMKLNINPASSKCRLVMRTDATLRVVLNTPVLESFGMDRATDRSVRFQGLSVDDDQKYVTYLGRFGSKADLDGLFAAVDAAKANKLCGSS
jgi:RanBP1 domain/NUP50 (Nucleoporin 50 kDa)